MLLCRESEHPSERERSIVVYSVGRARLVRSVLAACVDTCHPCHPADHINGVCSSDKVGTPCLTNARVKKPLLDGPSCNA
jgi:hypothetical protein